MIDPSDVLAHWGWVYDTDDRGPMSGEFALQTDGSLFIRSGGSSSHRGETTWRFSDWTPLRAWEPVTDADAAMAAIKERYYSLAAPGPVPVDATEAGPFPGHPERARYL
ncbi:hypothetical protein EDF46_0098 [Frondihabitans sp. PhB188]|uniref:hypothetical protein n=1 Tax=Frondihabitans sp. PhB188 TaxID=2485200 RepID=UPI000F4A71F5|nr:hypothetical protein [Frondihabitans sp. PhB188]ROQ40737.1 hypothetical protein EDF46_0098 [Frondihabitans sp. PhB188]